VRIKVDRVNMEKKQLDYRMIENGVEESEEHLAVKKSRRSRKK